MSLAPRAFSILHEHPWLVARFDSPQRMLSWAVLRPGHQTADTVAWLQVKNAELPVGVDPAALLRERLDERGLGAAVGLMTSSPLEHHQLGVATSDGVEAICLMTFGLSNGERIGTRAVRTADEHVRLARVGTINALCWVSVPLSEPALVEAVSIATQARTVAILADAHDSRRHPPVTGTGTDCIVMACPTGPDPRRFAGMHTAIGEALGAAVLLATRSALADWLERGGPDGTHPPASIAAG